MFSLFNFLYTYTTCTNSASSKDVFLGELIFILCPEVFLKEILLPVVAFQAALS